MNYVKTFFLMGLMTLLLVYLGDYLNGSSGAIMAFMLAAVMNFGSYWFSDKIILGMYGATEIDEKSDPELYGIVRELALSAGMPMPKVCVMDNPSPNAFATGRNPKHAAVAVTTGIRNLLTARELKGVLAHEMAHIKNRDILTGTVAATMAGAVMMISRFAFIFGGNRDDRNGGGIGALLMLILAPLAAMIIQMAISRSREYAADESGAGIGGDPSALADALRKLKHGVKALPIEGNPATAHLFIVKPFAAEDVTSLFDTHPPLEKRIERLENMRI